MRYEQPGARVKFTMGPAPTGLAATLDVRLADLADDADAALAEPVREFPAGSGLYDAWLTLPDAAGTYVDVWYQDAAAITRGDELVRVTHSAQAPAVPAAADWLPSVDDVASLVRSRTRDDVGNLLGTFTDATQPTADEVVRLIEGEAAIVLVRTGPLDSDALACPTRGDVQVAASSVIGKRVAAIIEASYRPEDLGDGRTVADFYQGSMKDDMESLVEASRTCRSWTGGDDGDLPGAPAARWSFPPAAPMRW